MDKLQWSGVAYGSQCFEPVSVANGLDAAGLYAVYGTVHAIVSVIYFITYSHSIGCFM